MYEFFFVMNHGRLVHQCMNRHRRVPHELHPHGAQRKWSVLVTSVLAPKPAPPNKY
jgi:hypothetical protein